MGREITIPGKDGSFMGYLALPEGGKGPGVVVIQEIFGVNPWVRSVADWLASEGYMALALDLFWRIKPGIILDPMKQEDFDKGLEYYGKFDANKGVEDIQSTITALRETPGSTGKVGNLGFCLGGLLSFLTATRTDTNATSSYYGGGLNTMLGEAGKISKPTLVHLAGNDEYIPQPAQDQIIAGLKGNKHITVHVYPGTAHGFCRATDPRHFNAAACKLAHDRTIDLFKVALA